MNKSGFHNSGELEMLHPTRTKVQNAIPHLSGLPMAANLGATTAKTTVNQRRSTPAPVNPTRYVRLSELLRMVPFSAATVYRKVKAKQMPAPIKFGERVSAWKREEVERWLAMQEAA